MEPPGHRGPGVASATAAPEGPAPTAAALLPFHLLAGDQLLCAAAGRGVVRPQPLKLLLGLKILPQAL